MKAPGGATLLIGGALVVSWILVALLAPWIAPFDPLQSLVPLAPPGAIAPQGGGFMAWR